MSAVLLMAAITPAVGQSGKISGTVTDEETGDPLPGVNVVIDGTSQGATTNAEGFYTILNVSPGTYSVRASFVGYTPQVVEDVDVNADLTSTVDFDLQEETVGLDEVTVQAQEPVVRPDVSANVANIDVDNIESMPVTSVSELVGLQAGVEGGLSIRGSGADELAFRVNGMSMRNPRNNSPLTAIPFTSLEAVQVQTGGFNAEYGNLRSGLINVTTREGARDRYSADVMYRYSPPARKHLGPAPNEPTAYLMRPYVSPPSEYPNADLLAESDVAYLGTHSDESPWDEYKRRQYPEFEGWRSVAQRWADDDGLPNLTPQQLKDVFMYYHRKEFPEVSDYLVDASFGGPFPVVSDYLGDLRFFASYRGEKNGFIVPQLRNADRDHTFQGTITSNIARGMKISGLGLYSVSRDQDGSHPLSHGTGSEDMLFARQGGSLQNLYESRFGGTFTHTVSPSTFYEVSLQRNGTQYEFGPGRVRSSEIVENIGGLDLTEAPFGFYNSDQIYDPSGMEIGGRWSLNRDSTEVKQYTGSVDITSQIAPYSQLKSGFDFYYTDFNSAHGIYNPAQPSASNPKFYWHRKASQGAAYVQNKLEFQGLIANVGLRVDYYKPLGSWYNYDYFNQAFANNALESLSEEPINGRWQVSPRLGISFPITVNSKLYFNYGHFRNTQQLNELFDVRTVFNETSIDRIGNPGFPMSKTVAYELGYDQNILDQFLLRISGYYKAQSNQPRDVVFTGLTGRVAYERPLPMNYGDVRGLEFTFERRRGQWLRGFINYTYMIEKSGNFGYAEIYENAAEQREFIRQSQLHYQDRPTPQPYANMNLELRTPLDFGPQMSGNHPLANWRLAFIGYWRAGDKMDYAGFVSNLDVDNNVQMKDDWNLDLRLTKKFGTPAGDVQMFVEVNNALNIKRCCEYVSAFSQRVGFDGRFDWEHYMQSLHLPEETFEGVDEPYLFPYGDDQPGDYRAEGASFVPIETYQSALPDQGMTRMEGEYGPLYFVKDEGQYYIWDESSGSFTEPDPSRVDQVLEDKAYIDMPNNTSFTFLDPRDVWFGLRFSF